MFSAERRAPYAALDLWDHGGVLRWVDVSRYQVERPDPLDLAQAKSAGYSIANVALTGGRGHVSGSWAKTYLDRAAELGLGRSTYHWLDGRTSGRDQATTQLTRLRNLVGSDLRNVAHCVDVEETGANGIVPPTYQDVVEYVWAMQDALGKFIVIYSGDWWWKPKNWDGKSLTPYLMGMPNAGALNAYPGDASPHWTAGWGGWSGFSVMQWGVAPLPGTGKCSLSVIRDHAVWTALSGGTPVPWVNIPASISLLNEFNALGPNRDKASDGSVGDLAHQEGVSDHNPDETGNTGGQSDVDDINEVHARDIDHSGPWPAGWNMERFIQEVLLPRCRAGTERRLRYIIYNRRIWSASDGWRQRAYAGKNGHEQHAHFSFRYGSGSAPSNPEQITDPWGLLAAVQAASKSEEDMPITKADVTTIATADIWPAPPALGVADGTITLQDFLVRIFNRAESANNAIMALRTAFGTFAAAEQSDDASRAQALAKLQADLQAVPGDSAEAVLGRLAGQSDAALVTVLRAVLGGPRAAAIGEQLANGPA